jgi:WS/DGAT/MGAT family acyltransferase
MRYHHCIGDGLAMMAVAQRLFDTSPRAPIIALDEDAAAGAPQGAWRSAFAAIEGSARAALGAAGAAWDAVTHPQQAIDAAARVLEGAGMLVAELLKTPDPPSPLKGEFHLRKRVAWSSPVPIAELKAIGAPFGAKVNDVLVAAVAGALRAYLKQRGVDANHTTVRAMVPVNLRPPERFGKLGNEFGLVILDLPVTIGVPMQRVTASKARMDALKHSPEAVAMRLLFDVFGRGPKPLEGVAQSLFGSKASVVLSNVAGPRKTLYLAGVPIDRMMFWVPHPGDQLGMGLSILSYRGMASFAVVADAHLVPDPQRLADAFDDEIAQMSKQLNAAVARARELGLQPSAA